MALSVRIAVENPTGCAVVDVDNGKWTAAKVQRLKDEGVIAPPESPSLPDPPVGVWLSLINWPKDGQRFELGLSIGGIYRFFSEKIDSDGMTTEARSFKPMVAGFQLFKSNKVKHVGYHVESFGVIVPQNMNEQSLKMTGFFKGIVEATMRKGVAYDVHLFVSSFLIQAHCTCPAGYVHQDRSCRSLTFSSSSIVGSCKHVSALLHYLSQLVSSQEATTWRQVTASQSHEPLLEGSGSKGPAGEPGTSTTVTSSKWSAPSQKRQQTATPSPVMVTKYSRDSHPLEYSTKQATTQRKRRENYEPFKSPRTLRVNNSKENTVPQTLIQTLVSFEREMVDRKRSNHGNHEPRHKVSSSAFYAAFSHKLPR